MRSRAVEVLAFVVLAGTTQVVPQAPSAPPSSPVTVRARASRKACSIAGISAQRLQEVIDSSETLQPPLAAGAMIRIAAKIASTCPALAKDLLQRAFDQSENVEPETAYKRARRNGTLTDTRVNYAAHAYSQQMDRLSLRSRVVLGMVPLDASKAAYFFQRMAPPRPPAGACANPFVPDVSIYYEALGRILALLKARKPRNDAEAQAPFLQLQEVVGATTSPVQLAPLAKVLEQIDLPASELSPLLSSLAAAVESFPIDDNSFYSDGNYPSVNANAQLVQLAMRKQASAGGLTHSFHDYLDRSLNGSHCAGNEPKDLKELVILYESLNRRASAPGVEVEPFSIPTSLPPIEPKPDDGEYWLSPKAQELLTDAKHLNFDDNWRRYTDADRKTPEWQDRVRHLLNDMDDWRPSDESDPTDYYHQRCMLLYRTLAYLPPGALYDRVVATWLATLAEDSLQWDNPSEWYFEVSRYLDFSKKDNDAPIPQTALFPLKNSSNHYLHAIGVLSEFLQ